MKRRKGKSIFLSAVLGAATLFGVGHGAFIVKGDASKDGLTISEGTEAVCYIKYSETSKTYYTSIEKAWEVAKAGPAKNQIYVIPGLDRVSAENARLQLVILFICLSKVKLVLTGKVRLPRMPLPI